MHSCFTNIEQTQRIDLNVHVYVLLRVVAEEEGYFFEDDQKCLNWYILAMPAGQLASSSKQGQATCVITKAKMRCHENPKNDISLKIKQEVTHRVIARWRKKRVVHVEAERRPPEIAEVAAWSLFTLEWLGSAGITYPCVVDHASKVV